MSETISCTGSTEDPELTRSMELVQRYQAGEERALPELLERYQDRVRRIVRIRMGARLRGCMESADIAQEAFLVAAGKLDRLELRGPGSIIQWLAKIVEHKISDAASYFRAEKRDRGRERSMAPAEGDTIGDTWQPPADAPLPQEAASANELEQLMDQGVEQLPEQYREVILLRDYAGGSWELVRKEMDRPTVHAVQELHRRAWIKLRAHLRPRLKGLEDDTL